MSERYGPHRLVWAQPEAPFDIVVDDQPVQVFDGQSIAAALWAAGVLSTRRTRSTDRPRGLFCGIGVCFDCLVTVNDQLGLRACQIEARRGDIVDTRRQQ